MAIKFKWVGFSDDGCYHVESKHLFDTQESCYMDMMNTAIDKMKWNVDFTDVQEDCDPYEEGGLIKTKGSLMGNDDMNLGIFYKLECHPHKIEHRSYSGLYTYLIKVVEC